MTTPDAPSTPASAPAHRLTFVRVLLFFVPPLVFVIGFPLAFGSAFHSPAPHDLSVAVAGPAAVVNPLISSLNTDGAFDASTTATASTAVDAVRHREVSAAIAIEPASAASGADRVAYTVTTYVASGGSLATSSVVQATGRQVAADLGTTTEIVDLAPVAEDDGTGANLFYLMSYSSLGGYVTITALLSFLPRARLRTRFLAAGITALGTPLLVFGLMSIFLGAYGATFGAVAATLAVDALYVFTVATVAIVANQILRSAAMAGVLTFAIFLNFPSSGGGVPSTLLPSFWRGLHEVYFGAGAVESFRSFIYFDGHGAGRWVGQIAAWTVGLAVLAVAIDLVRARRGGGRATTTAARHARPDDIATVTDAPGGPTAPAARSIPRAAVVIGTAATPVIIMTMLTVCFVSAGHAPTPHHLPITVAGSAAATTPVAQQLAAGNAFEVTTTTDLDQAREDLEDRESSGAFVVEGTSLTIMTAPAAGSSAATAVQRTGLLLAQSLDLTATTTVVSPLADGDTSGTTLFFLLVVCTVGAFLCVVGVVQARPTVTAREMLVLNGLVAVAVPLIAFGVLSIFAGAFGASFGAILAMLGVAVLYTLTIGMLATLATQLAGPGGIIVVLLLALALNLPSSGGASAASMLPGFWQGVHHVWIGAGGYESLRSIVYFHGHQVGRWLTQLVIWTAILVAGCSVIAIRQRRTAGPRELERQLESAAGLTVV